ncbi:glycoside hydrolase family 43 protein [Xylariales sp. AK1849]|nr:glycoside hydrolase family 43 protein [Xylariales sp. AK1849]
MDLSLLLFTGLAASLPIKSSSAGLTLSLTNIDEIETPGLSARASFQPTLGINFPDPSLIWGDGSWNAYGTSSNGKIVPVATSSDGLSWTLSDSDALPTVGSWVSTSDTAVWAPDVQKNDDGVYVMYYTAQQSGGSHCIGAATSTTAVGPFTPQSTPLICDTAGGGAIDASGYDDGTDRWITWKVDGNSLGGATTCQSGTPSGSYTSTPIMIQRMARDGLTLLDSPKTILDNLGSSNDGVVEAPSLFKIRDGLFVLFYSAHCYASDDYDIEYAFSSTIDGSYTGRGLLLRTVDNTGVYAPGGLDIDPNGINIIYHGRNGAGQGGSGTRYMYSATLSISEEAVSFQ